MVKFDNLFSILIIIIIVILHMQLKPDTVVKLSPKIGYFYDIPEAPGDNVEAPTVKNCRVFLQSTTQQSKFLKAGSWLLYRVNVLFAFQHLN